MNKVLCLTLFLATALGISIPAISQVYSSIGPRSNGLGGAITCPADAWSSYNNPGAFGFLEKTELGVSYENRFLLKELSTQALAFGMHTEKSGNFGVHFQQYGFQLYRETIGGFTYAMKLSPNFSAGATINYHGIRLAENYGSRATMSAGLGMVYALNDQFRLGMSVKNISRARLADFEDERFPTTFSLGFMYTISKKVFWTLDAEKDLIHPINIKSGLEIQAHELFALRLGVNSYPLQSAFGIGLKLKNFRFDLAAQWHTVLGVSPSGGLIYTFD